MKNKEIKYEMKSPFYKIVLSTIALQGVAIVLSLIVMASVASFLPTVWMQVVTTVFGTYLFCVLIYANCWSLGERDKNLVKYGHMEEDVGRGLRAGLLAGIPVAMVVLLAVVACYVNISEWVLPICRTLLTPFIGLTQLSVDYAPWTMLLLIAVVPLSVWLGYNNGFKLIRIASKIMYRVPRGTRERNSRTR